MRRRVSNINSLRMAKSELRNDLELRRAKIEIEIERLKDHYLHHFGASESGEGGWLGFLPPLVRPLVGNFIVQKVLKSKGKLTSILTRILLALFKK